VYNFLSGLLNKKIFLPGCASPTTRTFWAQQRSLISFMVFQPSGSKFIYWRSDILKLLESGYTKKSSD
jgi:hypothetical protein